jgi:hypothetical protein
MPERSINGTVLQCGLHQVDRTAPAKGMGRMDIAQPMRGNPCQSELFAKELPGEVAAP